MPPDETVARVLRVAPALGITRVANVTGLDCIGLPVVMVTRPNSRSVSVSQGKGLDLPAAKASGLMESVEGWHAERIDAPLVFGSHREQRLRRRLVDVERLCRVETSLFHADLPLLWIEGRDLTDGGSRWVPYEAVHTRYMYPPPPGSGTFSASSNGLASGNHLLEAISHAIAEIIERDATTLWRARRAAGLTCPTLDLGSVDDPACGDALKRFETAGVDVVVWPTATDVGVASFACLIGERSRDPLRRLYTAAGMGCHPNRSIALLRALTEAAQSRLTMIAGARDDCFPDDYAMSRSPDVLTSHEDQLARTEQSVAFREVPTFDGETFEEDVRWQLDRLSSAGVDEVVAVDLTRPELAIPVVRVVIPGLEGPSEPRLRTLAGPRALAVLEHGG